jgi:hypothetical protein
MHSGIVPVESHCQSSHIPHQPPGFTEGHKDGENIKKRDEEAQATSRRYRRRNAIFQKKVKLFVLSIVPASSPSLLTSSFHGSQGYGADFACFNCFPRDHWFRSRVIVFVSHRFFDRFIVMAIILNSVILALSDFAVVDENLNPASSGFTFQNGTIEPATSVFNSIVSLSEIPFTSIFTAECVLKIFALGFVRNKGSYLREPWNVLDFAVVVSR